MLDGDPPAPPLAGAGSALIVWPEGASLTRDSVRAPPPSVAVAIGGPVAIAGFNGGWHSLSQALALGLTETPPESCPGPYWVAGTVLGERAPPPPPRPPPPPPPPAP